MVDVVRVGALVLAGLALFATSSFFGTVSAQDSSDDKDAGDAIVVDPVNINRAITAGDSTSAFTFRLPDGAACQGDSANDDWRVQSFLVPAVTDIGSLRYRATRPDGDAYRSLRYLDGEIFVMEFTNQNEVPGQPGVIIAIPPLTMAWFETGSLEPGAYTMGIACTRPDWFVERYWDVAVDLEAAPEVQPGGLRWTVVEPKLTGAQQQGSGQDRSPFLVLILTAFAAIGGGVILIRGRLRRTSPLSQKEAP